MGVDRTRSYAILGTGAVGGFYGGLLARAGLDVHFLCRSDHEHVRREGLFVESKFGDFRVAPANAYADPRDLPAVDVAVVAIKSTENAALPFLLPPALGPGTIVLVLQNGLGVDDQAAAVVGAGRVLGGLCFLCSNKAGPGRIHHLDYGLVTLGEYTADGRPGGITPRLKELGADFALAGIPHQLVDDLRAARWHKLVWNVPFNGLSVVLDATTDEIMADPAARALAEELMREVAAGAGAVGKSISIDFVRRMLRDTERMIPYKTSMKLDYEQGRALELEAIFAAPLAAARAAGAELARMSALHAMLAFLDARRRRPPPFSTGSTARP